MKKTREPWKLDPLDGQGIESGWSQRTHMPRVPDAEPSRWGQTHSGWRGTDGSMTFFPRIHPVPPSRGTPHRWPVFWRLSGCFRRKLESIDWLQTIPDTENGTTAGTEGVEKQLLALWEEELSSSNAQPQATGVTWPCQCPRRAEHCQDQLAGSTIWPTLVLLSTAQLLLSIWKFPLVFMRLTGRRKEHWKPSHYEWPTLAMG